MKIITFENPILGVGIFEDSDGQFFNAEKNKRVRVAGVKYDVQKDK